MLPWTFFNRLQVWLNDIDVIKEAFLKRGDEFAYRRLPKFFDLMKFKDGKF